MPSFFNASSGLSCLHSPKVRPRVTFNTATPDTTADHNMPTFSPENLERINNVVTFARKVKTVKTAYTVATKIINVVFPHNPTGNPRAVTRSQSTRSTRSPKHGGYHDRPRREAEYERYWQREHEEREERRRQRRRQREKEQERLEALVFLRPQEYTTGYDKWRSERRFNEARVPNTHRGRRERRHDSFSSYGRY